MAQVCKFVYLDEYGQPSDFYEAALAEFGEETAEEMYIRHMFTGSNIKFDTDSYVRNTDLATLDEWNRIINDPEDKVYTTENNMVLDRVSAIIASFKAVQKDDWESLFGKVPKSVEEESDEALLMRMVHAYMPTHLKAYHPEIHQMTEGSVTQANAIREFLADTDSDLYKEYAGFIVNKWEAGTHAGSATHEFLEFILKDLEKFRAEAREEGKELKYGDQYMFITDRGKGKRSPNYRAYDQIKRKKDNGTYSVIPSRDSLTILAKSIIGEVQQIEKSMGLKPGQLIMRPEQKVMNEKMGKRGMAGSIDLLLVNPFGNVVQIVDFKTKTDESLQKFHRLVKEKIGGPNGDIANNAVNKAGMQMSHYGAMLHAAKYTVNQFNKVMVIKGYVGIKDTEDIPWDQKGFTYGAPVLDKVKSTNIPNYAKSVYEYHTMESYDSVLEKRRTTGYNKTIEVWSEGQAVMYRDNKEDYVNSRINQLTKNEEGLYKYIDKDPFSPTHQQVLYVTEEEYKEETELREKFGKEYDQFMREKRTLPHKVVSYFYADNEKDRHGLFPNNRRKSVEAILSRLKKDTHDIAVAHSQFPQLFGDVGDHILIVTEKDNPDRVSFLSVNSAYNKSKLQFSKDIKGLRGKNSATLIWGKFVSDNDMELMGEVPPEIRESHTSNDLISTSLAVAFMRYKTLYPNAKEGILRVGSLLGEGLSSIVETNLANEIDKLKVFQKLVPTDQFPKIVTELLNNNKINNPELYKNDALRRLASVLNRSFYDKGLDWGTLDYYNVSRSDVGARITENINKHNRGHIMTTDLMKDLTLVFRDLLQRGPLTQELKSRDNGISLLGECIMQLKQIDKASKELMSNKISQLSALSDESGTSDYYVDAMSSLRNESTERARIFFQNFNQKHQKKWEDVLDANGVNKKTGFGTKKIWERLMLSPLVNGSFKDTEQEKWMMLKSPDAPGLYKAEREYIKFFNEWVKTALVMTSKESRQIKGIESGEYLTEGLIPVMWGFKTLETDKGLKAFTDSLWKWTLPDPRDTTKYESDDIESMMMKSRFQDEVTNSGMQNSDSRLSKLGISGNSGESIPHDKIELSLPIILSAVVMDGANKRYIGELNEVFNAVTLSLLARDDVTSTEATREALHKFQQMLLFNKFAEEGMGGKVTDIVGKAASSLIFTASLRQALIEFSTAWIQGTSSLMANVINKFILRTKDEDIWFEWKDWVRAGKAWFGTGEFNDLLETMVEENGMMHIDLEYLNSNEYLKFNKQRLLKSDIAWGLNKFSINAILNQTFLAYAYHKGFANTYVIDTVTDKATYDETKDKRFYVYEENLGYGKKEPPKTEEDKKKHLLWLTTINDLKSEGMLYTKADDESAPKSNLVVEGRMKIPLSNIEAKTVREYAKRLFGSMSKDSLILFDYHSYGRSMSRYKRWFARKIKNYWSTRSEKSTYQTQRFVVGGEVVPLLQNGNHVHSGDAVEKGSTEIEIPADVILLPKDVLQFGTSKKEYTIAHRSGNIVTLSKPLEEDLSADLPLYVRYESGRYVWKKEYYEGHLQTIGSVASYMFKNGLTGLDDKLTRVQRDNFSKMFADMLALMIGLTISRFLLENEDIEFSKTDLGKTVSKALGNAYGELNIFATAYQMTDNIFPAFSTFGALLDTMRAGTTAIAQGEFESAISDLVRAAKTSGAYRSVSDVSELFTHDYSQ